MDDNVDWHNIGYAHGMRVCIQANGEAHCYPTRDKHSAEAEADFIAGYQEAQRDFVQGKQQPIPVGTQINRVFC